MDISIQGHYLDLGRGSRKWGGTQRGGRVCAFHNRSLLLFSRHLLSTCYVTGAVLRTGHTGLSKTLLLPSRMRHTLQKELGNCVEEKWQITGYQKQWEWIARRASELGMLPGRAGARADCCRISGLQQESQLWGQKSHRHNKKPQAACRPHGVPGVGRLGSGQRPDGSWR